MVNRNTTVGIDFIVRELKIGDKIVKVRLWDTAGQERYFTITESSYKKCQGVLLVYDASKKETFKKIHKWICDIEKFASSSVIIYLIANKIDIPDREVTSEEGMKLAKEYNMTYFETSAKTGKNIKEAIMGLVNEPRIQFFLLLEAARS